MMIKDYLDETQDIVIVNKFDQWEEKKSSFLYKGIIPEDKTLRTVMANEVVIEFDYDPDKHPECRKEAEVYVDRIKKQLVDKNKRFFIVDWENGRCPHVRFKIEGLQYHDHKYRSQYKKKYVDMLLKQCEFKSKDLKIDYGLITAKNHLVALENSKHFKHGGKVEIVYANSQDPVETMSVKVMNAIIDTFKYEESQKIEQVRLDQIKLDRIKEFIRQEWKPGVRNKLVMALGGMAVKSGLSREEGLELLRIVITGLEDDDKPELRERQFSYSYNQDKKDVAVLAHLKDIYDDGNDDFSIIARGKYDMLKTCFSTKELYISGTELFHLEIPPVEYDIDELVISEGLTFIAGQAGMFKSYLAMHIAHALSTKHNLLDKFKTKNKPVLYVDEENRQITMKERYSKIFGKDCDDVHFMISSNVKLDNNLDGPLEMAIQQLRPGIVILDSFVRFFTGDENSANDVRKVFDRAKYYINKYHVTVIIIHHVVKNATNQISGLSMRGSGDLRAQADTVLMIDKLGDNEYRIVVDKNRHKEEHKPFAFKVIDGPIMRIEYAGLADKEAKENKHKTQALKILKKDRAYEIEEIAEKLGIGTSAARKIVRDLQDSGDLVSTTKGKKKVYTISEEVELDMEDIK